MFFRGENFFCKKVFPAPLSKKLIQNGLIKNVQIVCTSNLHKPCLLFLSKSFCGGARGGAFFKKHLPDKNFSNKFQNPSDQMQSDPVIFNEAS